MTSDRNAGGFVLAQVALNSADIPATLRFYSEVFGFLNADGHPSWGAVSRVQGLPEDSHWMTWWMVGAQPFFQFEVFHHSRPKQRPLPADWRPSDHGWVRFGIAVDDFNRVIEGLKRWAIPVLGSTGEPKARRLAFRDPEVGVIVEVIEGGAAACPAVIYAAASVLDLAKARGLYETILGAKIEPLERLHAAEDEALWGLADAERDGFLVRLGDAVLEILSYSRPAARPRPADHRICDQGIMNIGVGTRDIDAALAAIGRVRAVGAKFTVAMETKRGAGTYVIEPDFEVELMGVPADLDAVLGFTHTGPFSGAVAAMVTPEPAA